MDHPVIYVPSHLLPYFVYQDFIYFSFFLTVLKSYDYITHYINIF